jgi:hypothetical protein
LPIDENMRNAELINCERNNTLIQTDYSSLVTTGPDRQMRHSLLPDLLHVLRVLPDVLGQSVEPLRQGHQAGEDEQRVEVVRTQSSLEIKFISNSVANCENKINCKFSFTERSNFE